MRTYLHIAKALKSERLKVGATQVDLAKACNCTSQFLCNTERAKCGLPSGLALKISKYLKCDFHVFAKASSKDEYDAYCSVLK